MKKTNTMNNRFVMPRRVEFADTDMAGIVHFAAFFRYMETAEHELFRSLGLTLVDMERDPHLGWPRVSCGFDFIRPLRFGDDFEVHIGVANISEKSVAYEVEVVREGKTIARGHSTSACCEVGTGIKVRSVPIPAEARGKLQQYLVRK
ncbi:MAG: acyl-CoA thioesterase [Phycisphaerales bacterium]|nr:MAG: acyl-CoA thioesterase [Phycisphaerales bacterium]